MHDGDGAVGHGVELVEAAGLEAGGHEEDVAAGRYAVRHLHAETHPPPALVMPLRLHRPVSLGFRVQGQGIDGSADQ